MGESEQFLMETFERLVWMAHEKGMISDSSKEILESMPQESIDELDQCYSDLLHMIKYQDYYHLIERIEKGQQMIAEEVDELKRKKYQAGLNMLIAEMELKRPPEHVIARRGKTA